MTEFDITPEALGQIKRLDGIFAGLLLQPSLAMPFTLPKDIVVLGRVIRLIRLLPLAPTGRDLMVNVHFSLDPRTSYRRLQFGPRMIDIGNFQVVSDSSSRDEWVSTLYFGAEMDLGSGCQSPRLVDELREWIDEIEVACRTKPVFWRTEEGVDHLGHMIEQAVLRGESEE